MVVASTVMRSSLTVGGWVLTSPDSSSCPCATRYLASSASARVTPSSNVVPPAKCASSTPPLAPSTTDRVRDRATRGVASSRCLAELHVAVELRAGEPLAGLADAVHVHGANHARRGVLGRGQRQLDVVARDQRCHRAAGVQRDVDHFAGDTPPRLAAGAGQLHHAVAGQHGVFERLAVVAVLEVDVARVHRLQPALDGAAHHDARVPAQLERLAAAPRRRSGTPSRSPTRACGPRAWP